MQSGVKKENKNMKLTDEWFTAVAENDSGPTVIIAGRSDIDNFKESGKFNDRIEITWKYEGGAMPDETTARQMEEACDALKKAVEKNKLAILTGVYTGGGKRIWVFYARHNGAFGETLNSTLSSFPLLPISIYAEKDPLWDEYAEIAAMQSPDDEE